MTTARLVVTTLSRNLPHLFLTIATSLSGACSNAINTWKTKSINWSPSTRNSPGPWPRFGALISGRTDSSAATKLIHATRRNTSNYSEWGHPSIDHLLLILYPSIKSFSPCNTLKSVFWVRTDVLLDLNEVRHQTMRFCVFDISETQNIGVFSAVDIVVDIDRVGMIFVDEMVALPIDNFVVRVSSLFS